MQFLQNKNEEKKKIETENNNEPQVIFKFYNSFYHARAVFFFSLMIGLNIISLAYLFGCDVFINTYLAVAGVVIWFVFWCKVYVNPKRYKRILHKFDNETAFNEVIGGIITFIYMVFSFIVFIEIIAG